MNLRDLDAAFVTVHDNGSITYLRDEINGSNALFFECPCGTHSLVIAFEPTGGGAPAQQVGLSRNGGRWQRTGDTLDTLTLRPSIAVGSSSRECWHGFITDGEVK